MKNTMMWWGYTHVDGSVHVKRYFSRTDIAEAQESYFVCWVYTPFPAESREAAIEYINDLEENRWNY